MQKIWENARIYQLNKEPGRSTSTSYPDVETILKTISRRDAEVQRKKSADYEKSLDGEWSFNYSAKVDERPVLSLPNGPLSFHQPDYDTSTWDTIPVPANWEIEGYGVPIYAPFHMPKSLRKQNMPNIDPDNNPVGSYRRTFTVPETWAGREIFIQFGGVCSAFFLWVNGQQVGYSQGSMLPAEFRLTPFLKEGENILAVEVYRWSDGSYLENQDMWFLSGIFRSVKLLAVPTLHIRDFTVHTDLDADYQDAVLRIEASVREMGVGERPFSITAQLFDTTTTIPQL